MPSFRVTRAVKHTPQQMYDLVADVERYPEFKSRTLGLLMGTMFDRAFRKFTDAFEGRANRMYGARA